MRRVIPLLLVLFPLFFLMPNSASQEVFVSVEGPEVMAHAGTSQFNVTASGGPAEKGGAYNITAFVMATNLSGASPTLGDPFRNRSVEPSWVFNVTVPSVTQTVTLTVNITSDYQNESEYKRIEIKIRVVGPIILSAEISNPLDYELREIPVDFYVRAPGEEDDRLVGSTMIESIAPGESEFASFHWTVGDPETGRYRLTVVVDLNRDGVIDMNAGDSVAVSHFYVGGGVGLLTYMLAVLLALLIFLSIIWLWRKPRGRRI